MSSWNNVQSEGIERLPQGAPAFRRATGPFLCLGKNQGQDHHRATSSPQPHSGLSDLLRLWANCKIEPICLNINSCQSPIILRTNTKSMPLALSPGCLAQPPNWSCYKFSLLQPTRPQMTQPYPPCTPPLPTFRRSSHCSLNVLLQMAGK